MRWPVAIVSDSEGSKLKFVHSVNLIDFVCWRQGELDFCGPGDFVFAGDAFDFGPHQLWIIERLVKFKEQHPGRVHWIVGNRDLNKLMSWHYSQDDLTFSAALDKKNALGGSKWLALELGTGYRSAFEASLKSPEGLLFQFYSFLQVGRIYGNLLVLHGRFPAKQAYRAQQLGGLLNWLPQHQHAFHENVMAVMGAQTQDPEASVMLLREQVVDRDDVIYSRWLDDDLQPAFTDARTNEYLVQQGIRWVVGGHTPCGIFPAPFKCAATGLRGINVNTDINGSAVIIDHDKALIRWRWDSVGEYLWDLADGSRVGEPFQGWLVRYPTGRAGEYWKTQVTSTARASGVPLLRTVVDRLTSDI